jgi:BRCA1-associated protein
MVMKDEGSAEAVVEEFSDRPFSSLYPDTHCRVVPVQMVTMGGESTASTAAASATPTTSNSNSNSNSTTTPSAALSGGNGDDVEPRLEPAAVELPSCPVCLEKLDSSVSGVCTILCRHSFHSSCLSQWGDSACPVCRFVSETDTNDESACEVCGAPEAWICLICAFVGCGRYTPEHHALRHFQETNHAFALELSSRAVWDYVGDEYCHRIITNKADGKLVETDSGAGASGSHGDAGQGGAGSSHRPPWAGQGKKKEEAIALEYEMLLTSQLEKQREYYEGQLAALRERAETAERAARQTEKRVAVATALAEKLRAEAALHESLNQSLSEDKAAWLAKIKAAEDNAASSAKLASDLQEQVRDLMFFLDAGKKIEQVGDADLVGGSATVNTESIPQTARAKLKAKK